MKNFSLCEKYKQNFDLVKLFKILSKNSNIFKLYTDRKNFKKQTFL